MEGLSRRTWLKKATLGGGLAALASQGVITSLSAEERRKFNPRPLEDVIQLSSNENPFGPSESMREAMSSHFDLGCRYPWKYNEELVEMISKKEGVPADHIVMVAGSTEGLKVTGLTFGRGGEIISCAPTFLAMMNYAELWDTEINWVPLNKDHDFDLEEIEKRVSFETNLVFLCNPNNPTGKLLPADKVKDFCKTVSQKTVVFSDEAYYDYISEPNYPSMVQLVKEGYDVIVSRTFSKVYGLAGIRLGYLIAKPEIAKKLSERVVANTNIMAIEAGKAALKDDEFYKFSLDQTVKARKMITDTLDEMNLEYLPSNTNFVFFHSGRDITKLNEQMLAKGVRIGRPFPPLNDWCRISTGTLEETAMFNQALKEVLG
ncbi:pyridoxal phosphate-dependent aminotransferase [Algoriphagus sediminis]|uniref:histidinol-phosphate transaminase n=1 Tax=Algoriphagus sediminis TaxID=3057113 RepID=A0ABT7YDP4_9BACT|nr:histidinol-phosphate transaminase [Algoriphagus sediminis]MDN3204651.1 histidinol-phosphate transaminase [Algoriphagus sediminis]